VRAIILAAGRGRRLDPYTRVRPKPLLYVAGRPILAHVVDALPSDGISDIVVVAGYLHAQIAAFLGGHHQPPALAGSGGRSGGAGRAPEVRLVIQDRLLGNGHAVYAARAFLDEPVLILFGDTILRGDLSIAVPSRTASIGVTEVPDGRLYGIVELDAGGRVTRLVEKPEVPASSLAVAGAFVFPDPRPLRDALDEIVAGCKGSADEEIWFVDVIQRMVGRGHVVRTFPVGQFYDCGTPERVLLANRELLSAAAAAGPAADRGQDSRRGEDRGPLPPLADAGSHIEPPCAIHPEAVIESSHVGPFVTVAPGARLTRVRIRDAVIQPHAMLREAVVEHAIVDGPAEGAQPRERCRR
jgi:glucose-1-phosphate thymidylyltransferase